MFAVIKFELDMQKNKVNPDPKYKSDFMGTLGGQYQILFGENPDI